MSTTPQQAAASDSTDAPTPEEKARIIQLQEQINKAEYPERDEYDPKYSGQIAADRAKLPALKSEYESLLQSRPALQSYASSHPATEYEIRRAGISMFGGSAVETITHNHQVMPTTDAMKLNLLRDRARQNPNATISEVVKLYEGSPLYQQNAEVDYEATLRARQAGYNVGSGIVRGLEPTFQKEEEKRFAEHNKIIGLTENIYTSKPAETTPQQAKTYQPQNPRPHILTGQPESKYANPDYSKTKQKTGKESMVELTESIINRSAVPEYNKQQPNLTGLLFNVAPPKPKQLTQEQVNALTPQEYENYRKEFEQYNQYVKYENERIEQAKAANIIVNREGFVTNRKAIAKYVSEAKAAGIKYINVETKSGTKILPIDQVVTTKGIIGISSVPNIPEGSTVFFSAGEAYTIPEQQAFIGPTKPKEQDYLKNLGSVLGLPDLAQAEPLQKYYNEPGRVTSNKTPLPSRELVNRPITMSPAEKASDFVEGLGTGLARTSLIITNAMPEAFIEIAKTGNPLAGEAVLQKHEKELKDIGLGPSVVPSIETGKPTGRSVFYNVGEAAGEVLPVLYGLKGAFKNPFSKAPVKPKIPEAEAPEIATPTTTIKAYPVAKLRNLGLEERPILGKEFMPPEEKVLAKIRAIPEPPTQIGGGKGAKDFGNLRQQIANIKQKEAQIRVEPVKEDVFYNPAQNIEKVRAKEIGTYRVESERMLGQDTTNPLKDVLPKTEPSVKDVGTAKPSVKETLIRMELEKSHPQMFEKNAFERSAIDAEIRREANKPKIIKTEVRLGAGAGKLFRGVFKGGNLIPLGTGRGFYVSRSTGESGGKRFSSPRLPPDEGERGKGKQVLLLEKPAETKGFKETKVNLGTGKGETVLIAGAGAGSVAPLPLVLASEQDQSTVINGTATNGTSVETQNPLITQQAPEKPALSTSAKAAAVTLPKIVIKSPVKTIASVKQKQQITQRPRQKTVPAEIVKPAQKTVQREKLFSVLDLGQPEAFAQKQRQGTPFPFPQAQKLKTPTPFPQPQKLKQPEPLRTKEPPPGLNFGFARAKEFRERKAKELKPNAFVGNVSDVDIALGFNRKEITSGIKRSAKRYKKDIQFAYKREGFTKLVTQKNRSILSKKQRSILEREKPKEVKKKKRKTGGFF